MCLEVRLLGQIELRLDEGPLPLPATRKAQSLLAYLVTRSDRPQPREQLADRFWPNRPRDKALHNLSTVLWHIRRVLPPGDYILADAQMMQFNPQGDFWLDVKAFSQRVNQATGHQVKEVPRKAGKVLLKGEAGIGKTHPIEEFADRVRWQAGQIALGRCCEYERPLLLCAISEACTTCWGSCLLPS